MDKLIQKFIRMAKKNKWLAFPALLCVFALILAKNVKKTIVDIGHMDKTKKMIAAAMALVLVVCLFGPLGNAFRSMRINAGTNPFVADWTESQANYYWYTSAGSQNGLEYTIDSVQDLYELAALVNGTADVPGLGLVCDNFYGKNVYFNFTQLDMQCREFPVIGQDSAHPFLGNFTYRPFDSSYVDSIDTMVVDHYYSEDSTKQLFGYTTMARADISVVDNVAVNVTALSQLQMEQGNAYDYKYDADAKVLYLPVDSDVSAVRKYPVFLAYRSDSTIPWRSELAYTNADGSAVDFTGVIAEAGRDGTLSVRLGAQAGYSLNAFPGWDPANTNVPVNSLTISVVPRNTIVTPAENTIRIEGVAGNTVNLSDWLKASDMNIATASITSGNSVSLSGNNLSDQVLTIAGYGETRMHVSSGIFSGDDRDIIVVVTPPVDSIEWNVNGGVATSGNADYEVYLDAVDGTQSIECTYNLKNGSEDVTQYIDPSLVVITGIGEDMNRVGNAVTFIPSSEHYSNGDIVTLTAGYGSVTKEIVIGVAASGIATFDNATSGNAIVPQASAEKQTTTNRSVSVREAVLAGADTTTQVMADMGSILLFEGESAMPLASPDYQGNVFGITSGSFQMNRYHKVTISANNDNGGYAASVVDKDGAADYYAIDENVIFLKNECNFDLNITLDPTYEIRGNVVVYPVNMQNTTINLMGQLLEKVGETSAENGGKVVAYALNSQGAERFQDCTIVIENVQSTNTNISAVVLNGQEYPLRYIDNGTGTDVYTADIAYKDFPGIGSQIAADNFIVSQSVQELNILSADINEDGTVCQISGYIRPQDGLTESVNYVVILNRLPNDEALMKQLYIGDELVADFTQPDSGVWVQEAADSDGVIVCKVVYNGTRDLMDLVESDISFDVSDYATWSGILQEGVNSPHLFLNKYEDSSQLMFDVMITSQSEEVFTKYRVVLQAGDKVQTPSQIVIPDKVQYDPLQYQYIITDMIRNADYSMEQAELIRKAGGDGESFIPAQQNVLRDRAQQLVSQDLLVYYGLQVNVVADVDYVNQYVPAKQGTFVGAPGMDGEDGVYYFKAYITSNNGTTDITWEPISGRVRINATKYVPVEIETIHAENGSINLTLKDVPTECEAGKFEVEYAVDVLNANDQVIVSGQRTPWGQLQTAATDDKGVNYAIKTPLLGQREQKQRVTVYVRYHYDDTTNEPYVSDSYEIAANDQCLTPQSVITDKDGNILDKTQQYNETIFVRLNSANAGVENEVYYTIGGDGTGTYQKYVSPIEVSANTTIYAYAENKNAYMSRSGMFTESYTVQIPTGVVSDGLINKTSSPAVSASGMDVIALSQSALLGGDVTAVKVWLEIADWAKNVSDYLISADTKLYSQAKVLMDYCKANNYYDYYTYNMKMMRRVTNVKGYEVSEKSGEIVTVLPGRVRITLTLPEELQGRTDLLILQAHTYEDGNVRIGILADLDNNPATFTFETDRMSLYAIVAKMDSHMKPPYEEPTTQPTEEETREPAGGSDDDDDSSPASGHVGVITPTQEPSKQAPTQAPTQASTTGNKVGVANGSNNAVRVDGTNSKTPTSAVVGNNTNNVTTGNNAQTGDKAPIMLLSIALIVSFILMIIVFIWGMKRRK